MSRKKEKLPDFDECMRLMRKRRDPEANENGFHFLLSQAHQYTQEIMDAFNQEGNEGLKYWLMELLVEARHPDTLPLFISYLQSNDESFQRLAIHGLQKLDTKEARRALWETGFK